MCKLITLSLDRMSSSQGPSHGAHDSEHTTSNDVSTTQSSQRDFGRFPPLIFNNRFDAFRSRVARTVYFPAHFVHGEYNI